MLEEGMGVFHWAYYGNRGGGELDHVLCYNLF